MKKNVGVMLMVIAFALSLAELILRLTGYYPGQFRKLDGFELVDSLITYQNFETDEGGIYKFSSWVYDSIPKYYNARNGSVTAKHVEESLYNVDNIDYIYQSYARLSNKDAANNLSWKMERYFSDESHESEFEMIVRSLKRSKHNDSTDEWSAALMNYADKPYNREGFKGIEFKIHNTKRKRILLIGDSFVYGMSARPYYNSFSDILLAKGYMVYSAGIPGTDPAQYAAIARKYLPALRPDLVVVCFYPGNDMMGFERDVKLGEPHEHITNAGFFQSNINGKYYSALEAYAYYASLITIPENGNVASILLRKSAIGGLLWGAMFKIGAVQHPVIDLAKVLYQTDLTTQIKVTKQYVREWNALADSMNIRCVNVIIPEYIGPQNKHGFLQPDSTVLSQIFPSEFFIPDSFSKSIHFPENDCHFNNLGSKKYADFLERLIKKSDSTYPKANVEAGKPLY